MAAKGWLTSWAIDAISSLVVMARAARDAVACESCGQPVGTSGEPMRQTAMPVGFSCRLVRVGAR
jgi:hypothetical protein